MVLINFNITKGVEMKKKFTLALSTTVIIALTILFLIPAALPGSSDGTTSITRLYGETI